MNLFILVIMCTVVILLKDYVMKLNRNYGHPWQGIEVPVYLLINNS